MEEGQGAGEDSEEWLVEMMVWCTSRFVRILILWKTSLSGIERKGVSALKIPQLRPRQKEHHFL